MQTEFEFIDKIRNRYSLDKLGDDCAVLPKDSKMDQVVTADLLVEDIDFHLEWTNPEFLGHKSLAVSLSDVAAMGARPVWSMLSIGIPENVWNTDFIDRFYEGWFTLAGEFAVELVGGDVSRAPDKIVIDSVVGGKLAKGKAILRSTAKAGDAICVSGSLGGASGGLKLLDTGFRFNDAPSGGSEQNLISRQLQPRPQLRLANILQSLSIVNSMIDLSDGLSSDLNHLCTASGLGARIYSEKIPVDENLASFFSPDERLDLALNGGEDFELLFTVNEKHFPLPESVEVTVIGEMTADAGLIELVRNAKTQILDSKGFRHFQ